MATQTLLIKQASCVHYWLIENNSGETSRGVCKLCGAKREFFNNADHRDISVIRTRAAAGGRKNKGKKRKERV